MFPLRPNSVPDMSTHGSARLLDELGGYLDKGREVVMPDFSPELRSQVLDLVAGTCRKSRVP